MSDPIAEAAAGMAAAPSSAELAAAPQMEAGTAAVGESLPSTNVVSQSSPTGNVLVNETPTVDAPAVAQGGEQPSSPSSGEAGSDNAELPRESHLMLLEHKLAAMHAKFKTGERIVIDEFEQILGHIKAVL